MSEQQPAWGEALKPLPYYDRPIIVDPVQHGIDEIKKMLGDKIASLESQLAEAKERADELDRRRGGECDTCGGWVCPPLRCVGCMTKQRVTPNADPSSLMADSLKKQDADLAELRSQLAAATRRAEEAEQAEHKLDIEAERLAQENANLLSRAEEAEKMLAVVVEMVDKAATNCKDTVDLSLREFGYDDLRFKDVRHGALDLLGLPLAIKNAILAAKKGEQCAE